MFLNRMGNKRRILKELMAVFPENINTFVDMFMGSGTVSFAMIDSAEILNPSNLLGR